MKKLNFYIIIIVFAVTSCMTFNANIKDISEEDQLIEVKIYKVRR
jgi:hypothetical protein